MVTADELSLGLEPRLRQETLLAPQLRASLRVLQMDAPTLLDEIRHAAETNPVVELEEPEPMSVVSDALASDTAFEETHPDAPPEDESNPSVNFDEEAVERRQRFFDRQVAVESLQEHLLAQIQPGEFDKEESQLAEFIIGDIDSNGRYVGSFDELIEVLGVTRERLETVLGKVQRFDPPGVGARDLRECLRLQIDEANFPADLRTNLLAIIDRHLDDLAAGDEAKVSAALDLPPAALDTLKNALRTLEPKPGRPYLVHGRNVQYIRPELTAMPTADGVELRHEERQLPVIHISPTYETMAQDRQTPQETRAYLRERLESARQLMDAVTRRGETILRIAEVIFSVQGEFFRSGFDALRPLTIEEVARRTGFHGTTVGRAVRGKYVRTPRGVFELKQFFCVGRLNAASDGSVVSAVVTKRRLAQLVETEEGVTLNDEDLATALSRSGIRISRRTISKYRAELGIPSALERVKRRNTQHEHA